MAKKPKNPFDEISLDPDKSRKPGVIAWLRARFFAGIVVAAPIAITIWIIYSLVTFIDVNVKPLIPALINIETYTQFAIPGFGVLAVVIALTLLGIIATNLIGRSLLRAGERIINSVPYVRWVYRALKQIFETFANQGSTSFKEVVLIEYPKPGTWCLGFLAANAKGEVAQKLAEDFVGVFVPTTPNPTSGFLMYVHESEVIRLQMSVEDGAKMIISGGLVAPAPPPETPELPGEHEPGEVGPPIYVPVREERVED